MTKSKQVEEITTKIQDLLQESGVNIFPKMYHVKEDSISLPMVVDNKQVIVEIRTV
jgi:hypothetical protein